MLLPTIPAPIMTTFACLGILLMECTPSHLALRAVGMNRRSLRAPCRPGRHRGQHLLSPLFRALHPIEGVDMQPPYVVPRLYKIWGQPLDQLCRAIAAGLEQ